MDERGVIYSTRNPSRCIHLKSGTQPTYNGDGVHMWEVQQGEFPGQEWVIVPVENVQWQPKEYPKFNKVLNKPELFPEWYQNRTNEKYAAQY